VLEVDHREAILRCGEHSGGRADVWGAVHGDLGWGADVGDESELTLRDDGSREQLNNETTDRSRERKNVA
jgi:hypothetical protein